MHSRHLIIAASLAACTSVPGEPNEPNVAIAPPPQAEPSAPVFLVQRTVPTGSTNADVRQGIVYAIEGIEPAGVDMVVATIRATAAFRDTSGHSIAVSVTRESDAPIVRIVPATELDRDAWYVLTFASTRTYVVKPLDSMRDDADVTFFTGSAPMVRYIFGLSEPKGPERYLLVFMSEPVRLGSLAGDAVSWTAQDGLAGCVYRDDHCVSPDDPLMVGAFQYNFSSPVASVHDVRALRLAATVRGSARSVADGRAPAAARGQYAWTDADWTPCHRNSATICWTPRLPL
jgi:hypothetical protein